MLGHYGSVMLLTPSASLALEAQAKLSDNADDIATVFILGGPGAVSEAVRGAVKAAAGL